MTKRWRGQLGHVICQVCLCVSLFTDNLFRSNMWASEIINFHLWCKEECTSSAHVANVPLWFVVCRKVASNKCARQRANVWLNEHGNYLCAIQGLIDQVKLKVAKFTTACPSTRRFGMWPLKSVLLDVAGLWRYMYTHLWLGCWGAPTVWREPECD